jgi:hypothetical protein
MTTETNQQEEAQRIWEELDAKDAGQPEPKPDTETTTAVTAEEAATQTPNEVQPEQVQNEDDPAALRNKIAGLEVIVNQLQGRVRNTEGHIGGLSSQLKGQIEAARAVQKSGGDAPSAKAIQAAQGDPVELQKLQEEYPEFAKVLAPAIDAAVAQRMSSIDTNKNDSQILDAVRAENERFKAFMEVEFAHRGWQAEVKKPEFQGWIDKAPREVRMLAESPEPADAVRLLDLFKESQKAQATPQTKGISTASALPAGRNSGARTKSVNDMTPQEYWAYLDQLDKQKG